MVDHSRNKFSLSYQYRVIRKESDLEQRLGECQNNEAKLLKPNFQQAKVIESLAYKIIGSKDREFLDGLLTFMSSYDL